MMINDHLDATESVNLMHARAYLEKDLAYRRWNAIRGGVYVPVDENTPPNPYLEAPHREITTSSGETLTLVNPAYMTRQVHDLTQNDNGVLGHITSLKPIRPGNEPDEWEKKALIAFENGTEEVHGFSNINGTSYLRYMRPLKAEKACLSCHAKQGYKEGDIRGGLSISIPHTLLLPVQELHISRTSVYYALLWLIGTLSIIVGTGRLISATKKEQETRHDLKENQNILVEAEHMGHMGSWELDINTGKAYWSKEIHNIVGSDPNAEIGPEYLCSIVNPNDWPLVERSLDSAIKFGTTHEIEYRINRPDNEERWIYCKAERKVDGKGHPSKLAGIAQDITDRKKYEEAISNSEDRLRAVIQHMPVMLDAVDAKGNILVWNSEAEKVTGYKAEEMINNPKAWETLYPDSAYRGEMLAKWAERGDHRNWLWKLQRKDGKNLSVEWSNISNAFPIPGWASWGIGVDVTEREKSQERVRLAAKVFESTAEGIVITDINGNVIDANKACTEVLGYELDEIRGQNPRLWSSGKHDAAYFQTMWTALLETGQWHGEIWNRRKNGEIFPEWLTISSVHDENHEVSHYVGVFTDITQIKRSEEQLNHLAHHDALTDLPNRLLLTERLNQALKHAQRNNEQLAVIFLDLDNFKHINDSLGHSIGDELLKQVASILTSTVRAEDTVARIGGDEFVILISSVESPSNVASIATSIASALDQPLFIQEREIHVTCSIGISLYPRDGDSATTLLRNADAAMYRAKEAGRNNYQFYTEELTRNAFERVLLENNLGKAIANNEFVLLYQPQLDIHTRKVIGAEALIRWNHPELGLITPDRFIPLAEETGLIMDIGKWVLETACKQAKSWSDAGVAFGKVSVNIAGPQVRRGGLPEQVRDILLENKLDPRALELEVTEGFIMQQAEFAIQQLHALRNMRVSIAIDDFGTGYSSLSYLKQLPIDKLKIDKSFVRDIPQDADDMAIANAVIALARSLDLTVIAEGVETEEQAHFLASHGCDEMQGYLALPAVDVESFEAFVN